MAEHNVQALQSLLSLFGLNQPRPNPSFNPSQIDAFPQLIIGPDGQVEGVTQPDQTPRYKTPGLLGILAGNPAAQMNADRANQLQQLSASMYLNAKMAELNHLYATKQISAREAADRAIIEAQKIADIAKAQEAQRMSVANTYGALPEVVNTDAFASANLQNALQAQKNKGLTLEGERLMSASKNRVLSNSEETDRLNRLIFGLPLRATSPVYDPFGMEEFRPSTQGVKEEKSFSMGPDGKTPITTDTKTPILFPEGTFSQGLRIKPKVGYNPDLSIGPERVGQAFRETPNAAISKDKSVDTNAQQALAGDNSFVRQGKVQPTIAPQIKTASTLPQQSQLPLGEVDPFGVMQSYKNTFNRQWVPTDDRLNTLLLDQTLQRLQLR